MSIEEIAKKSEASQHRKELAALLLAISHIDIKTVVEIGVHRGHSLQVWDWTFNPEILIGVDTVDHVEPPEYKEKLILGDSTDPTTIEAVTTALGGREIDFLFIDGNHLEDFVWKDWRNYGKLVREGGVIVFHDVFITDNETVEVFKFWSHMKNLHSYQEIHFLGGTGIGILFK